MIVASTIPPREITIPFPERQALTRRNSSAPNSWVSIMRLKSTDGIYKNNVQFIGFLLVVLVGLFVFGALIAISVVNNTSLNHVSGAWIAMAMDLRDGVFYRPLFDESTGFGGTRFFPLYFSLISMVTTVLDSAVLSGHMISLFSGMLMLWACYLFLRRVEVKPVFAVALCVLLLSSSSIRNGFGSARGDIFPLALNILGLVVYMGKSPRIVCLYVAGFLFVLAFATKVTAIHGLASLFIWLVLAGRGREGFATFACDFCRVCHITGVSVFFDVR